MTSAARSAGRWGAVILILVVAAWVWWLVKDTRPNPAYETNRPSRGSGPIVVRTYSDFSCNHCAEVATIFNQLFVKYPTQLTLEFRYVPLTKASMIVDVAAECSQQQGRFWEYHDQLFQHGGVGSLTDLLAWADAAGLEPVGFADCLEQQATLPIVQYDTAAAFQRGVDGTPTVFVNGTEVPWPTLVTAVDQAVTQLPANSQR